MDSLDDIIDSVALVNQNAHKLKNESDKEVFLPILRKLSEEIDELDHEVDPDSDKWKARLTNF